MIVGSFVLLEREDLVPASMEKPVNEIVPPDFKSIHKNIINSVSIVLFNDFADDKSSDPTSTVIFKNKFGLTGTLKV